MTSTNRPIGRPSLYTPELADKICNLVATTTLGTNKLCKLHDDLPDEGIIYDWRWRYEDFNQKYVKAKSRQAELMAEKLHELCDVPTFMDSDGIERVDSGRVALQRLKVDTVKWEASKLAPKIYGERKQEEQSNPQETLSKIQALVADLNKTNESEI